MSLPQAVFFDLGDTVVRIKLEIVNKICLTLGQIRQKPLGIVEYLEAFRAEWNRRQKPSDKDNIKRIVKPNDEIRYWNDFFTSLLTILEITSDKERSAKILAKIYSDARSFDCFEDVHEVLAEFKAAGLKLGVISNAFPSANKIINRLGLGQYFDFILLSYEFEYIKPEPEIYRLAVEKLDVEINKSIFVDDRWSFVKAAIELGMDAYLIERITPLNKDVQTKSLIPRISDLFELRNKIFGNNERSEQSPFPSEIKKESHHYEDGSAFMRLMA